MTSLKLCIFSVTPAAAPQAGLTLSLSVVEDNKSQMLCIVQTSCSFHHYPHRERQDPS